ncbi:hypothetical protein ACOMHN_060528 [Nucella lapillus]
MGYWPWLVLACMLLMNEQLTFAKLDKSLYCSICRAVVQEINARIAESDPNKMVQVSSFRMGINGKKHVVEKPYARSNEHLSKIFAEICETMKDYGLRQLPERKLTIVRVRSRSGEDLGVAAGDNENIQNTFKVYCETLIDESEDDMWTLFKLEDLHTIESELCVKLAGMCTMEDLLKPFSGEPEPPQEEYSFHRHYEEPQEELYATDAEDWDAQGKVIEPVQDWDAQGKVIEPVQDWDSQGKFVESDEEKIIEPIDSNRTERMSEL